MGTDDPLDTLYMFGRFLLSGLCFAAAVPAVAYAIKVRARLGRDVRLAHIGAALLIMAATVSAVDAVENVFILTREPTALSSWMRLICIDMLLPFYAYLLVCAWQERDQAEAELSRLLVTDPLTGTLNRRGFFERAIAAAGTASRAGQAVSVIMLDLDRFKDINDGFGHAAGDEVLRRFAAVVAQALQPGDVFGRVGGEEFAVVLPGCSEAMASGTAERLRERVRALVAHPAAHAAVTVSTGVACLPAGLAPEPALLNALSAADGALYAAKQARGVHALRAAVPARTERAAKG